MRKDDSNFLFNTSNTLSR